MRLLKSVLIVLCITLVTSSAFSQEIEMVTDKGSNLIAGAISFSSSGGELHENFSGNRKINLGVGATYCRFIIDHLALGGSISYGLQNQGDNKLSSYALGPSVGYYFEGKSRLIPFLGVTAHYLHTSANGTKRDGRRMIGSLGLIYKLNNLGILFEVAGSRETFEIDEDGRTPANGNALNTQIGLIGFF